MLLMSLANLIWGKYAPAIPPDADATRHIYALAYNFSRLSQPRFLSLAQRALCAAAILRRAAAEIVRLERGGWGRLRVDEDREQNNPDRSEDPWGGERHSPLAWRCLSGTPRFHPPCDLYEMPSLYVLLAPLADLTRRFAQPTGTFTSRLSTDWSPAPSPDIATVATGQVPRVGFSPASLSASIAAL